MMFLPFPREYLQVEFVCFQGFFTKVLVIHHHTTSVDGSNIQHSPPLRSIKHVVNSGINYQFWPAHDYFQSRCINNLMRIIGFIKNDDFIYVSSSAQTLSQLINGLIHQVDKGPLRSLNDHLWWSFTMQLLLRWSHLANQQGPSSCRFSWFGNLVTSESWQLSHEFLLKGAWPDLCTINSTNCDKVDLCQWTANVDEMGKTWRNGHRIQTTSIEKTWGMTKTVVGWD